MTREETIELIRNLAEEYNREEYFAEDPISFPKHFCKIMQGEPGIYPGTPAGTVTLQDIEIAGLISAHLAWGRRNMIVRDCIRAFDQMGWQPLNYVMYAKYRSGIESLHRTIRWSEFAAICSNMRSYYSSNSSVESLTPDEIRVKIYGQASNPKMANKKIHMFRRWMTRRDGIVDLGLWKNTNPKDLIIPLDTHVHASAIRLGITSRKSADYRTAEEITAFLREAFPQDPCKGDFALFAYACITQQENKRHEPEP